MNEETIDHYQLEIMKAFIVSDEIDSDDFRIAYEAALSGEDIEMSDAKTNQIQKIKEELESLFSNGFPINRVRALLEDMHTVEYTEDLNRNFLEGYCNMTPQDCAFLKNIIENPRNGILSFFSGSSSLQFKIDESFAQASLRFRLLIFSGIFREMSQSTEFTQEPTWVSFSVE